MENELIALRERVTRAERQGRSFRALVLALLVFVAVILIGKQGTTEGNSSVVKAPFQVVDDQGKTLMVVGKRSGRLAVLQILGGNGVPVVSLEQSSNGVGGVVTYVDRTGGRVTLGE